MLQAQGPTHCPSIKFIRANQTQNFLFCPIFERLWQGARARVAQRDRLVSNAEYPLPDPCFRRDRLSRFGDIPPASAFAEATA